jgi:poly(A) polymerase
MKYSTHDTDAITDLVALHLRFHTYQMGWTDSAVRRYVRDAGPLLNELNVLTRCDCTTRNERKALMLSQRMDELEARIAELAKHEELAALRPELDGAQVMEMLSIDAGRQVGDALKFLMEIRLEEGLLGEVEARRRLEQWWSTKTD